MGEGDCRKKKGAGVIVKINEEVQEGGEGDTVWGERKSLLLGLANRGEEIEEEKGWV